MVSLAINTILCFGILAATGGLILWLADPLSVAFVGTLLLAGGALTLAGGTPETRIPASASTLVGAGLLIGGAGIELMTTYPDVASPTMLATGAAIALLMDWRRRKVASHLSCVMNAIILMGVALHVAGVASLVDHYDLAGAWTSGTYLYLTLIIALAGWRVDVRFVTALAIFPFAQVLDTGTQYFNAAYMFYSPESTLSLLQMTVLSATLLWLSRRWSDRDQRHARVLAILAFVIANLCALVGSLRGDYIGETLWGPGHWRDVDLYPSWSDYYDAREAFRETALYLSADVTTVLWGLVLALLIGWAAHKAHRGLFNASMTFAGIHAYTQAFETFYDQPLAYVIGGAVAILLAWGMWRLNQVWLITKP